MSIKKLTNNFSNKEINEFILKINKFGYVKINNFLKIKETKNILNLINNIYKKNDNNYSGIPERDSEDKIIYNLHNKNKIFNDLLVDKLIVDIIKNKLNDKYYTQIPNNLPNCTLKYFNARSSGKKLDLHIDSYFPYKGEQTILMQFAIFLEKSGKDNGCTVIVPGSHKSGKYTDRKTNKKKLISADPGDLLIWDSRTWHGTTSNQTNLSRWAIIITFGQWWIKPSMEITSSISQKMYSQLNKMQKQILGFCSMTPSDESQRINTKNGYDFLKRNLKDYN